MDRDSDVNAALDTIADFSTQSEEQDDEPFELNFNSDPNESEVKILKTMMTKWVKLNNFRARLWYIFRDTLKNGDAFFLRDPETQEWLWLDHFMVEMVKVDDTMGKDPDEYLIRGLDYNKQTKFGSKQADPNQYRTPYGTSNVGASRVSSVSASSGPAAFSLAGAAADPRQRHMLGPFSQDVSVVDAQFVVHLSLSIGNDINWPFGTSILEPIFKVFKQKELLEDAIIIYRVQRAPERRIFYIDTGTMPPERAKRHIEMIKNDIHQRRIPNRTGTGGCFDMSTRVPLLDGRVLSLTELAAEHAVGKQNWAYSCDPATGEIVPGKITWAGVTRHNATAVRLTLDNGETIVCTPDHKFPIFGRGKTEAKDIVPEIDSLISFNTRLRSIRDKDDDRHPQYHQIYDHASKSWRFTHRLVAKFMKRLDEHNELGDMDGKVIIHHNDFNKFNNYCFNHKVVAVEYLDAPIDVGTVTIDGNEEYHGFHTFALEQGVFAFNSILDAAYNPLSINDDYFLAMCFRLDTKISLLDGRNLTLSEVIKEHEEGKQNLVYSLNRTTHELEPGRISWAGVTRRDATMVRVTLDSGDYVDVTPDHRFILRDGTEKEAGALQADDSLMPLNARNHKVVSVELLPFTEDTGDITIESPSDSHVFALAAGIYVHNSADGRGSKVETLPGGENVGEISDLMYFTRKIARGLRVPTSYINLGEGDEGAAVTFNDGKLGAAMIQEFRFTKYCMRWQSLLAPIFDKEFKRYLLKNGIEMDWGLFELRFRPPQSFTRYRQIELDAQRVQVYQGVSENKRLAERFKLTRFLGLTEDELIENEKLWAEENADKIKRKTGTSPAEEGAIDGLSAVGVRPMGDEMPPDMEMPPEGEGAEQTPGMPGEMPAEGAGGGGGPAGAAPMGGGGAGGGGMAG